MKVEYSFSNIVADCVVTQFSLNGIPAFYRWDISTADEIYAYNDPEIIALFKIKIK